MAKLKTTSASGVVPEYGAIFITNERNRQECFERRLFGAPFNCFPFIKQIKAGMVLFLLDYGTRRLYGVFEATTDGNLNIVPEAFQKSGGSYPSQVCFKLLWRCFPLSEEEFRGAIKDNYYAPYKFKFGLSKDQVQRLLSLFYSKKIIVQKSVTQNNGKRKRSESLDVKSQWVMGCKRTPELGEIENSVRETPSQSAGADSSCSSTLLLPSKKGPENVLVSPGTTSSDLEDYIPLPLLSPDHDELTENVLFSLGTTSSDLEDYIPLFSPEHDELTKTDSVSSEARTQKEYQSESAKGSNDNEDHPLSEECINNNVIRPQKLNQGPITNGFYKRSPIFAREIKLLVKGLYADKIPEKKCIFSRLNSVVTPTAGEELKDDKIPERKCVFSPMNSVVTPTAGKELKDDMQSPDGLMRKLQESHKFTAKSEKLKEDRSMKIPERKCVFSPLNSVVTPTAGKELKDDLQSPDGLMRKLQESHKFTAKSEKLKEDRSMKIPERKCVFSPLNSVVTPTAGKELKDDLQSPDGLMRKLQESHKFTAKSEKLKEDRSMKISERKRVFSPLNSVVTPTAGKESKDDLQSPDGLMRKLQESHKSWKLTAKSEKLKEDRSMKVKVSAFSRLTLAPKKSIEKRLNMRPCEKPICKKAPPVFPKKERQSVFLRLHNERQITQIARKQDSPQAKKPMASVFADPASVKSGCCNCLVHKQITSQDLREKGDSCEKCLTKSEVVNAVKNGASQKEVVTRKDRVPEVRPKPSLGADEGQQCGGKDTCNRLLVSEKIAPFEHVLV